MKQKETSIRHNLRKLCPRNNLASLLLIVAFLSLNLVHVPASPSVQQEKTITGNVTDQSGEPVPGASVTVVGSAAGTITDDLGNFTLTIPDGARILSISFVGMETVELEIGDQTVFNVTLQESVMDLDEVVVIGYGTIQKSHLTGAISKVTNEGLEQIPTSRIEEALVGKISGVNIQMVDATAGSAPTIRVRGIGSITADPSPLIVLDGVVVSSDYMGTMDMNDIESVEVLKDAASAAIYGSRGGNGVIMLTTKKGTAGKTQFSFNTYRGFKYTFPKRRYEPFSTIEQWKDFVLANNNGQLTEQMEYIELMGTENRWPDVFFERGAVENYSLSARGGTDVTKYSISTNYMHDEGVLMTDDFRKASFRLNINTKPNKRIEFGGLINPSYSKQREFGDDVHAILRVAPWLPIYIDDHNIQFVNKTRYPDVKIGDYARERLFDGYILPGHTEGTSISTSSSVGPVARVAEVYDYNYNFNLLSNLYATLHILNGLDFTSSVSASYRSEQETHFATSKSDTGGTSDIESDYDTGIITHLTNENILSYNRLFGKHKVSAIAGMSVEKWEMTYSEIEGSGYANDYIRTINAASQISGAETEKMEESLAALISRFNYAYDNKLLLSVSARYDGSSRFGADTKWGFFPAASVGYRISQEDFMKEISWLSNLKPRISYGVTGNNTGIGYYSSIGRLESITAILNGDVVPGFNPMNISNTDLRWEKSVEWGPGIDIGILENRVTMSLDYYTRNSKDLLLDQEIASVTGFNTATVNIGEVKNSGFEMELGSVILSSSKMRWSASVVLSHNVNELIDFAGASGLITYEDAKRPAEYIALEGNPISSMYGYKYLKDIPIEWLRDPFYPINGKGQSVYVQDMNGDGVITTDDRTILGSPYPKWVWGFNSTFNFSIFDLTINLQGSHGAKTVNMDPQYWEKHFDNQMNYQPEFPDKDLVVPRILTDKCVQDASYIALRNVNLGCRIPSGITRRIGIGSARFYLSGQNLLLKLADSYTSFNPEGVTETTSPLRGGYQRGSAPIPKAVTLGLTVDF